MGQEQGASGLAYFTIEKDKELSVKVQLVNFLVKNLFKEIMKISNPQLGYDLFSMW